MGKSVFLQVDVSANKIVLLLIWSILLIITPGLSAGVIDLSSVIPGGPGTGTAVGTLDGNPFTATLLGGGDSSFLIGPVGASFEHTVISNSSLQYSDGSIYNPSQPLSDQVGLLMTGIATAEATLRLTFGAAVINPVIHIANLDSMTFDFSPSVPSGSLSTLSGNGDGVDGLHVDSFLSIIEDRDPTTFLGVSPSSPPTASGPRSAYGSVQINGSFTLLDVLIAANPSAIGDDGVNFTLTTTPAIPAPSALLLSLCGFPSLAFRSAFRNLCLRTSFSHSESCRQ